MRRRHSSAKPNRPRSVSLASPTLQFEPLEPRTVLSGVADLLFDVNAAPIAVGSNAAAYVEVNGVAYFTAAYQDGRALWKTDGTAAGTTLVRAFDGISDSSTSYTFGVNVGRALYFSAADQSGNLELWKSDGTAAG